MLKIYFKKVIELQRQSQQHGSFLIDSPGLAKMVALSIRLELPRAGAQTAFSSQMSYAHILMENHLTCGGPFL